MDHCIYRLDSPLSPFRAVEQLLCMFSFDLKDDRVCYHRALLIRGHMAMQMGLFLCGTATFQQLAVNALLHISFEPCLARLLNCSGNAEHALHSLHSKAHLSALKGFL